jgi:hypothetical protein
MAVTSITTGYLAVAGAAVLILTVLVVIRTRPATSDELNIGRRYPT